MENLVHDAIQFDPQTKSSQKPELYLHHPLLAETIEQEMDARGITSKKTSRQRSSRTEMKKPEVVLTTTILQERISQRVSEMTPEGKRELLSQTVKPFLAANYGVNSILLRNDSLETVSAPAPTIVPAAYEAQETEPTKKTSIVHKAINILCYLTQVFCRSMNVQSLDELLQTLVMQKNQKDLERVQEGLNHLANADFNTKRSAGSWKFWTAVGVTAGVLFAGGFAFSVLGAIPALVVGALCFVAAPIGGALLLAPLIPVVVAGLGLYFGFKYLGEKKNGENVDLPNLDTSPSQSKIAANSSQTTADSTLATGVNNLIQEAAKRLDDASSQIQQLGKNAQQAIEDLAAAMSGIGK